MNDKHNTKKILLVVFAIIIVIVGIFGIVKLFGYIDFLQHRNEVCSYDLQIKNQYNSEQACFETILNLKNQRDRNYTSITKSDLDNKIEEKLTSFNDDQFNKLATTVLNNTTVALDFDNSEIIKTFIDDGSQIYTLGEDYENTKYYQAFSSFLTFFRDEHPGVYEDIKYEYDCVYYICYTLYPEVFTQGIIDTFKTVYGFDKFGEEILAETISYVSSSPEGIEPYEEYIATAKKHLEEQKTIKVNEPKIQYKNIKMKCVSCGAAASNSFKHIFTGETEWYCNYCYTELKRNLAKLGLD